MNLLSFEDTVIMEDGAVDAENCPTVVPLTQYTELVQTINRLGQHFDEVMVRARQKFPAMIALTHSQAFSCMVRKATDGYVIIVPLGVPARIRVLSKLLIQYWGREKHIATIRSPLDKVSWDAEAIPPMLKPIFSEEFEKEDFWKELGALDASIETTDSQDAEVSELVHLALVYMISHEFTHVLHGHFDLLNDAKTKKIDLTERELNRGLETDADDGAASLSMYILDKDIRLTRLLDQPDKMKLGWLRLAYAVTMIYAVSGSQRKFFAAYEDDSHNHPMVRCELFFSGVKRAMSTSISEVKQSWLDVSTEGWKRCVLAFYDLDIDAMKGKYGPCLEGVPYAPLHALLYGASPALSAGERVMLDKCKEATELMYKIRKHLPLFNR
jgi:hypothetical protein